MIPVMFHIVAHLMAMQSFWAVCQGFGVDA
jgi:hypothetical protein